MLSNCPYMYFSATFKNSTIFCVKLHYIMNMSYVIMVTLSPGLSLPVTFITVVVLRILYVLRLNSKLF